MTDSTPIDTKTPDKSQQVLDFWFEELTPRQHFIKDESLDDQIRQRFAATHSAASRGELINWRQSPQGQLAEIIVLDQFSRNLFRNEAASWAQDELAQSLAMEMVESGNDQLIEASQRVYVYMPFMHAESLQLQDKSVALFNQLGNESTLKFAHLHRDVIVRFGRFPYRNDILGRDSTAEELEYTKQHGSF